MDIVFATHNNNKLKEVQQILPKHINLLSLDDINCHEEIDENADSIEGNAILKANYIFKNYNHPCFADDTGLFAEALNGEPGVYSARYAGPQKNAEDNNNKLLERLKNIKNRAAHFKTVIAYKTSKEEKIFTGICPGIIISSPEGHHGFGYDPLFKPKNYDDTFATLDPKIKNKISHRALAIQKLLAHLKYE
jgi:XTP/dITP diphosphohydrolase